MFPICFGEENIEREQVIVSSSLRQGITFPSRRSQLFYCDDNSIYSLLMKFAIYNRARLLSKKSAHAIFLYLSR